MIDELVPNCDVVRCAFVLLLCVLIKHLYIYISSAFPLQEGGNAFTERLEPCVRPACGGTKAKS